jgi:molecular chaperone DnaK
VVTVPAYFDDAQRQATRDAGEIAGLEVRAIPNEPTAAALAYGLHRGGQESLFTVFDLGGGTFDVSILRIEDDVFEVLATSGDTFLGGDDFDRRIVEALIADFKEEAGIDLSEDPVVLQRLKAAAEAAKQELSTAAKATINLSFVGVGAKGPVHLIRELTRPWLESLTRELVDRLQEPCHRALTDAGLPPEQIDQVILVGGMTRMPLVQEKAASIFGRAPSKGVNPDEIVAIGAATQTGIMTGALKEVVLLDVTPHTLGIRVQGDRLSPIIRRNVTVPARETKTFATTEDDQDHVVIEVYQGDNDSAPLNRLLGQFVLGGLTRAPAGSVQVQVSFSLDSDGILNVDAIEAQTGRATSKKILASSGLSR